MGSCQGDTGMIKSVTNKYYSKVCKKVFLLPNNIRNDSYVVDSILLEKPIIPINCRRALVCSVEDFLLFPHI